jgi:predicted lipopolysaccharide heptosyltransferase III
MSYKNILIVRLSAIGDVLHCTPLTRALREKYPEARISWIVADKSKDVLLGNPFLDEIVVWDKDEWRNILGTDLVTGYQAFRTLQKSIQAEQYDMIVDVHAQFIPGLITWKSGALIRVGFSNARELAPLFYTRTAVRENNLPITQQYLGVLAALGISEYSTDMIMPIAPENHQNAANIWEKYKINATDKVIVLNPSTTWMTKCWPTEHFAQLGNYLLQETGIKILLTGAKADIPLVTQIKEKLNGVVVDITGSTSLKDLAAIAQKCHLFVSGDTGPLHIAAAVGTPTLSLFGPTDPQVYTPLGEQHSSLLTTVPCRLCRKRKCDKFICMEQIDPKVVYQEVLKMLHSNRSVGSKDNEIVYKQVPIKRIPMQKE